MRRRHGDRKHPLALRVGAWLALGLATSAGGLTTMNAHARAVAPASIATVPNQSPTPSPTPYPGPFPTPGPTPVPGPPPVYDAGTAVDAAPYDAGFSVDASYVYDAGR